ncbi:MAG: hypothetical protein ACRC7O_16960, partial [Fimbriiglobus sp.]
YNQKHRRTTAAEAVATFDTIPDARGWEVVIPRRIKAGELHRVRAVPPVVGWRYHPDSHRTKPCGCDYCQRGRYGASRIRAGYNQRG